MITIDRPNKPWTMKEILETLARANPPFKPLFKEYKGQRYRHLWQCTKCGHRFCKDWKTVLRTLTGKKKGGCIKCINRDSYSLTKIKAELRLNKRPVMCISKEYKNNKAPMLWKCKKCKYEWKAAWKAIKGVGGSKGHDCIVCANNVKYTIERIQEIVKEKKIALKLLSTEYKNNVTPLKWECVNCGNIQHSCWAAVNCTGNRCSLCSTMSATEMAIKDFLNKVFPNAKFIKTRPEWLRNEKTGYKLEIDIYSEFLGLAIEVNGDMHYRYKPMFHKRGISDLHEIMRKDKFKKDTIEARGLKFIEFPINNLSRKRIKEALKKLLILAGYRIPRSYNRHSVF